MTRRLFFSLWDLWESWLFYLVVFAVGYVISAGLILGPLLYAIAAYGLQGSTVVAVVGGLLIVVVGVISGHLVICITDCYRDAVPEFVYRHLFHRRDGETP